MPRFRQLKKQKTKKPEDEIECGGGGVGVGGGTLKSAMLFECMGT